MTMKLAAVLWDMDGTIIDTEPFWLEAEMKLAEKYGVTWTMEDALRQVGQGLTDTAANMLEAGMPLTIDEMVVAMIDYVVDKTKHEQIWRPGAIELLRDLRANNVPTALVTMSYQKLTHVVLDFIGFDAFDVVVTGDAVSHAKPHPAPYLMAAEKLGVDIGNCIAFEDSIPGITSAHTSGALSIAVENHIPIPEHSAYLKWETLAGLTTQDLENVFSAERANRDK